MSFPLTFLIIKNVHSSKILLILATASILSVHNFCTQILGLNQFHSWNNERYCVHENCNCTVTTELWGNICFLSWFWYSLFNNSPPLLINVQYCTRLEIRNTLKITFHNFILKSQLEPKISFYTYPRVLIVYF